MTMRTPEMSPDAARYRLQHEHGIEPGSMIYVIQRAVSQSGMTRYLSLFVSDGSGVHDITAPAAVLLNEKLHDARHALKVEGCGMDMHFHTVYRLSRVLFDADDSLREDAGYALNYRTL